MVTDQELNAAAERIARAAANPVRVVLFGSRARGEHGPDSDVDLLVIERGAVADRLAETHRLRTAVGALSVPVDLMVVPESSIPAHLAAPMSLVARALHEGRDLAA